MVLKIECDVSPSSTVRPTPQRMTYGKGKNKNEAARKRKLPGGLI
jgi:hypothetical protein